MLNSIICSGKTTNEAIEEGLKKLNVSRNKVDIKVLDNEEKRSFFNILTPRVVKVELTIKENEEGNVLHKAQFQHKHKDKVVDSNDLEYASDSIKNFLQVFFNNTSDVESNYNVEVKDQSINVNITGENSGFLIGYRGDVLNSLQTILTSIANKNTNSKIRVVLDVENYRNKRKKVLEELAVKVSKTVLKTGKSITLEPMGAYERKIIHSQLQDNKLIKTYSIGEEPNRRVVISKK